MLRYRSWAINALKRLHVDKDGVASFEYVILSVCIITIVGAVFNAGASGPIKSALTNAMSTIGTAVNTAVGG